MANAKVNRKPKGNIQNKKKRLNRIEATNKIIKEIWSFLPVPLLQLATSKTERL